MIGFDINGFEPSDCASRVLVLFSIVTYGSVMVMTTFSEV
jgi:hypothetical protein